MKRTREEINEELAHQRAVIRALNARRRPLEVQAATKGINTPPEVLTELSTLLDQIRIHEEEIARLETSSAEGQLPLAEAQYQVELAEAWSTPQGRPTAVGIARLELERLRLGVQPDRALAIEQTVRVILADENLSDLDLSNMIYFNDQGKFVSSLDRIVRAYRLDPSVTFRVLTANLTNVSPEELNTLKDRFERLLISARIWTNMEERSRLARFVVDLKGEPSTPPNQVDILGSG